MQCPHCEHTVTARTSPKQTAIYREVVYQCRNVQCGHVLVCGLEAIHTLSPSAMPNPEVNLALSRFVQRCQLISQLQFAIEL